MNIPRHWSLAVLAALLLIPSAAFAKGEKKIEPVGPMLVTPNMVQWNVLVDREALELSVSGPDGEVLTKSFKGGQPASFTLQDLRGKETIDGTYTYELRVVPRVSEATKHQLENARANNDEAAAKKIQKQAGLDNVLIQSGAFSILNGSFISPDLDESLTGGQSLHPSGQSTAGGSDGGERGNGGTSATAVRLHPVSNTTFADDVIAQGSLCVGFDCVTGESFGFDTIRLKENNTRIRFFDTSNSASFPTNDWQLTANDSANGGANKFSIDDIDGAKTPFTIRAGAASNSIFVGSTGRVGFRTATPVLDLHVATGNTPGLRLEQNSSGGFSAQTWDIAGNEANFFIRDVTSGSRLPFRIRPGAPTSSIDIAASGNVGIGSASPGNNRLYVFDTTQTQPRVTLAGQEFFQAGNTSSDGLALVLGVNRAASRQLWIADSSQLTQNNTNPVIRIVPNSGEISAMSTNAAVAKNLLLNLLGGNVGIGGVANPTNPIQHQNGAFLSVGGVWTNASSRDLKLDICDLDSSAARNTLQDLKPVTYAYKVDPEEHHVGFIAEDAPDIVASKDHKGMSAMDVVAVLTKVVQDQQKTIEDLQRRLDQMEKKQQ